MMRDTKVTINGSKISIPKINETLRQPIAKACLEIDQCLKMLHRLEAEAFDESDFNSKANTSKGDTDGLKDALENISDEAVTTARKTSERLIEARLHLKTALEQILNGAGV